MFRDDRQRARVCQALCALVGFPTFWTDAGPSPRVKELLEADGGPLSHGEKVMVFVAWALWNSRGGLTIAELVDTLDRENLTAIGELLSALANGPAALDAWLAEYSGAE